jgi:hypothetical protein
MMEDIETNHEDVVCLKVYGYIHDVIQTLPEAKREVVEDFFNLRVLGKVDDYENKIGQLRKTMVKLEL